MTVMFNEHGQQNVLLKNHKYVMEVTVTHNEKAEQLNGRRNARRYCCYRRHALTGQLIPGIW